MTWAWSSLMWLLVSTIDQTAKALCWKKSHINQYNFANYIQKYSILSEYFFVLRWLCITLLSHSSVTMIGDKKPQWSDSVTSVSAFLYWVQSTRKESHSRCGFRWCWFGKQRNFIDGELYYGLIVYLLR